MSDGGAQWKEFGPFFDNDEDIYRGIKVLIDEVGTTTDKRYWTDEAKTTPVDSGVLEDSNNDGIAGAFFDGDYRFRITQSDDSALDVAIDWDDVKVTSDTSTMWEGNFGTSYPSATAANIWQQFALVDSSDNLIEIGYNVGSQFTSLSNSVNVKGFGATGDGSTDDSTAINTAIKYAFDNGLTNVLFPQSDDNYIVSTAVLLPKNITLWGYGATVQSNGSHSAIETGYVTGGNLVTNIGVARATAGTNDDNKIFGLFFKGDASTTAIIINLNYLRARCALRDLRWSDAKDDTTTIGLKLNDCTGWAAYNLYSSFGGNSGTIMQVGGLSHAGRIFHCNLISGGVGLEINGSNTCQVFGGVFQDFSGIGGTVNAMVGVEINGTNLVGNNLYGNHFEGCGKDVHLGSGTGTLATGVIEGCFSTNAYYGFHLENCRGYVIRNNNTDASGYNATKYLMDASTTDNIGNEIYERATNPYDWTTDSLGLKGGRNSVYIIDDDQARGDYRREYVTNGAGTPRLFPKDFSTSTIAITKNTTTGTTLFAPEEDTSYTISVDIIYRENNSAITNGYRIFGVIERDGSGNATIIGQTAVGTHEDTVGDDCVLAMSANNVQVSYTESRNVNDGKLTYSYTLTEQIEVTV